MHIHSIISYKCEKTRYRVGTKKKKKKIITVLRGNTLKPVFKKTSMHNLLEKHSAIY